MEKKIVQHNAITQARYEMTALEMDIVFMLLAQLGEDDEPYRVYQINAKHLQELSESEVKLAYFKEATEKLIGRVYEMTTARGFLQIGIVSSAEYITGTGIIELSIDPKMRPYLFSLKSNFTTFQLKLALQLKSKYSKRLYQLLSQFKDTGEYYVTIESLKLMLKLRDAKTGEEQYKNYADFEKYVIKPAQKQLKEHTDISFTYKIDKQGRKYHALKFSIVYTPKQLKIEINPESQDMFNKLVNEFKLAQWQAERVIQVVPPKEISRIIYNIRLMNSDKKIKNIGAYTAMEFEKPYNLGIYKFE